MSAIKRIAAAVLLLGGAAQPASAQGAGFLPFDKFVAQLSTTPLSAQAARPQNKVSESSAFEEMRGHLLGLYAGMTVKHSYVLASHPYDCVPVMQQPSVRQQGLKVLATPPTMPSASPPLSTQPAAEAVPAQIDPSQATDPYGNAMGCESGTIPMRRVTLEDVGRFKTLADFFRKGPSTANAPQRPDPTVAAQANDVHKYAYRLPVRQQRRRHD